MSDNEILTTVLHEQPGITKDDLETVAMAAGVRRAAIRDFIHAGITSGDLQYDRRKLTMTSKLQKAVGLADFVAAVPSVPQDKLTALWNRSTTFHKHWYTPNTTKVGKATKSEASILFSCLAHFKFTRDEALNLMNVWFDRHGNGPRDMQAWIADVLDVKEQEARNYNAPILKKPSNVLEKLTEFLVIEQFSYDPETKRCSVAGIVR
jgi:hypothetical protein